MNEKLKQLLGLWNAQAGASYQASAIDVVPSTYHPEWPDGIRFSLASIKLTLTTPMQGAFSAPSLYLIPIELMCMDYDLLLDYCLARFENPIDDVFHIKQNMSLRRLAGEIDRRNKDILTELDIPA